MKRRSSAATACSSAQARLCRRCVLHPRAAAVAAKPPWCTMACGRHGRNRRKENWTGDDSCEHGAGICGVQWLPTNNPSCAALPPCPAPPQPHLLARTCHRSPRPASISWVAVGRRLLGRPVSLMNSFSSWRSDDRLGGRSACRNVHPVRTGAVFHQAEGGRANRSRLRSGSLCRGGTSKRVGNTPALGGEQDRARSAPQGAAELACTSAESTHEPRAPFQVPVGRPGGRPAQQL